MKGFSAAAAIVLSTIASVTLFGLQISASWFARFWQGERLTSLLHLLLNVAGAYSVHSDGLALLSLILAVQQFPSVWNVAFTGLRWLKWLQSWNRGCSFSVRERRPLGRQGISAAGASCPAGPHARPPGSFSPRHSMTQQRAEGPSKWLGYSPQRAAVNLALC